MVFAATHYPVEPFEEMYVIVPGEGFFCFDSLEDHEKWLAVEQHLSQNHDDKPWMIYDELQPAKEGNRLTGWIVPIIVGVIGFFIGKNVK
jgi:hypothetical protein